MVGGNGGRIHDDRGERWALKDVVRISTALSKGLAGVVCGDIRGLRHHMPVIEHIVTLCAEFVLRLVPNVDIDEDTVSLTSALRWLMISGQQATSSIDSEL